MPKLFEVCGEQEWAEATRGQHRGGPRAIEHQDIAAAVRYLAEQNIGTKVKVKCTADTVCRKRDAARDHAYRRGISVTTRYLETTGYVLIEFTK